MAGETPAIGMPRIGYSCHSRPYHGHLAEAKSTWITVAPRSRPRFAGGIENQSDTTAAILLRFAYPFGIEGKVPTRSLYKLR